MSSRWCLIVFISGVLAATGAASAQSWSCLSNGFCPPGYFCKKADGNCGGVGSCTPIPEYCIALYDPVCGCDGRTYSNGCVAGMKGVSVAHKGPCAASDLCMHNGTCGPGSYCAKPYGECRGMGVCQDRPGVCPTLWDPVCGCDGRTYGNSCGAAAMGVSVAYRGVCGRPRITSARSAMNQGSSSYGINLLPAGQGASAGVECRAGGPTEVLITFDMPIQSDSTPNPSDVSLSVIGGEAGEVVSVVLGTDEVRIGLADIPDACRVTIAFPGIVGLEGNPVEGMVSFGVLCGDVNGDGFVNIFDLVTVRNAINQPATSSTCRKDVNADGAINVMDLIMVRNGLGGALPEEPAPEAEADSPSEPLEE